MECRRRFRFVANANFDGAISYTNLLDMFLFAATATQGYEIFEVVRIVEVEVWHCPMSSSVSSVLVEFDGENAGFVGDSRIYQDSSMGTQPAHVRARPAKNSAASMFQPQSATTAFRLTVPSGGVVDVLVELRSEFNRGVAVGSALVGATAGASYLRGLDGQPIATTVLVPQAPTAWCK
jgi:hypothetical protein